MAAGARRRFLPAWMGAAGEQQAVVPPKGPRRQRQKTAAASRAAAAAAAAVVYCMNEAELVDVAMGVLAENLQRKEGEKSWSANEEEEELQLTPDPAPGNTASAEGGSDCSPALPSPPDAGAHAVRTGWEDSEDDALKYVREIFFS